MRVAREEIFGPVLCVPSCRDEKEAISIANDTHYGPQANVFSSDLEPAQRANDRIEGGFKQSGFGREFGVFGLEAFLEPRPVHS
ncbi:aldehyde dehydrogenase family protein [Sinorhizobium meliloti]|nr:aldehyde dehydrogenase family protein [Sinorhizobium meliloti]MDW9830187.1 aldehyde dehydrogenase family protein [Sinorhizobium meliloti]MDX0124404.1 aldehyde dehydrogenase family protein [Sinorhizobium meliloti]MDX0333139.1 aldehyde dehydrogenase family protein [Sinorhizobium meliloti]RVG32030.1 aldehyde dehydrogenase family protein [Sinorhizobium meliloti]